jgi:hypothetical protein
MTAAMASAAEALVAVAVVADLVPSAKPNAVSIEHPLAEHEAEPLREDAPRGVALDPGRYAP